MSSEFAVKAILQTRGAGRKLQYLVHWEGYSKDESTWEPPSNLTTCQDLVDAYHTRLRKACKDRGSNTSKAKGVASKQGSTQRNKGKSASKKSKKDTRPSKGKKRKRRSSGSGSRSDTAFQKKKKPKRDEPVLPEAFMSTVTEALAVLKAAKSTEEKVSAFASFAPRAYCVSLALLSGVKASVMVKARNTRAIAEDICNNPARYRSVLTHKHSAIRKMDDMSPEEFLEAIAKTKVTSKTGRLQITAVDMIEIKS